MRRLGCGSLYSRCASRGLSSTLLPEHLPGSRQRVTLAVNEPLDLDGDLDVAFAIEALSRAAFVRLQLRKLRFPESQHVWLDFQQARNIPDLEIETSRDSRNLNGALRGWMRCHNKTQLVRCLVEV